MGHAAMAHSYAALLRKHGYEATAVDVIRHDHGCDIRSALALHFRALKSAPWAWRHLYRQWSSIPGSHWFKTHLLPARFRRTCELLMRSDPSLIVTTHPLATAIVSLLKRRGVIRSQLFVAFFNWHLQPFWLFPKVDGYLVATERQAQALIAGGIPRQTVAQVGILVDECYYGERDRTQYRRMIGAPEHDPALLVMSGGTAWRMEDFVRVICQLQCAATVYIIGVDDVLKPQLEFLIREQLRGPATVRLLGYTDARPYLRAVDVVLTKPGVSVAEGLALGIPTILAFPIPGHDELALDELLVSEPVAALPAHGQAAFLKQMLATASTWKRDEREEAKRGAHECPRLVIEAIERWVGAAIEEPV